MENRLSSKFPQFSATYRILFIYYVMKLKCYLCLSIKATTSYLFYLVHRIELAKLSMDLIMVDRQVDIMHNGFVLFNLSAPQSDGIFTGVQFGRVYYYHKLITMKIRGS